MGKRIKTIHVGWGEISGTFTTSPEYRGVICYDEIIEENKQIANNRLITVYRCYINKEIKAEIEAGQGLTITYY